MPIIIPAIRLLRTRAASRPAPTNAASAIIAVAIMPNEAVPWSSPRGGAAQRESEAAEAADREKSMQRCEGP